LETYGIENCASFDFACQAERARKEKEAGIKIGKQTSNLAAYKPLGWGPAFVLADAITVNTQNTSNTLNGDGTFSGNTKNQSYSWSKDASGKPVIVWENKKGASFGFNNQASSLKTGTAVLNSQTDSLSMELSATKCQKICNTTGAWATTCPNTKRGNSEVCIPGGPAFVNSDPAEEAPETATIAASESVRSALPYSNVFGCVGC